MIGYVTLGTNDLQGNAPFYDAIAREMGTGRMMEFDSFIAWGEPDGAATTYFAEVSRTFLESAASLFSAVPVSLASIPGNMWP